MYVVLPDNSLNALLHDLGRVLEFREWVLAKYGNPDPMTVSGSTMEYTGKELATIIKTADHLMAFACKRGWSAVTQTLFPVATLGRESVARAGSFGKAGAMLMPGFLPLAPNSCKQDMVSTLFLFCL